MATIKQVCTRCGDLTNEAEVCWLGDMPVCPDCVPFLAAGHPGRIVRVPSCVEFEVVKVEREGES